MKGCFAISSLQTSLLEIPPDFRMRNRIEGGETVKKNRFGVAYTMPWQVGLTVKGGMEILEGATIICPNFVIGCAHMVKPKGMGKRTPEWKWNWKTILLFVKVRIMHHQQLGILV